MKNKLFLIITLFAVTLTFAQNTSEIGFNEKKEVLLNGQIVDTTTDLETIKSLLGEPTLYKEYPTGKVNYQYPELGIAIHLVNGKLTFIGANFNWDGDKTFPEASYTGKFSIGDTTIDMNSTPEVVSKIEVITLTPTFMGMYMTNPKENKTVVIMAFKDEKVTQVGFEFQ